MAARSPARFLAPLALVGFVLALLLIVSHSKSDSGSGSGGPRSGQGQSASSPAASSTPRKSKGPRFYTIKAGDTPSAIAEKTGVTLSAIEQLNPDLDPQTLTVGTRIKLRKK
jgi:LysM repeat protein